jgi:two-component system NtrC family response regulator
MELSAAAAGLTPITLREARENVERMMIEQALKRNSGRITSAATDLGISRPTLYELMEKLGIARSKAGEGKERTDSDPVPR